MKTIIIDEKTVSIDGVIFERKEPEFKVGQWVMVIKSGHHASQHSPKGIPHNGVYSNPYWETMPYLIASQRVPFIDNKISRGSYLIKDESGNIVSAVYIEALRPATHFEIEQHLIKVAKEKGFKEGITVKPQGSFARVLDSNEFKYIFDWQIDEDALACGFDVIWRTKVGWAEIISSKKPIPKTKDDLEMLLIDFQSKYLDDKTCVADFLKDYE